MESFQEALKNLVLQQQQQQQFYAQQQQAQKEQQQFFMQQQVDLFNKFSSLMLSSKDSQKKEVAKMESLANSMTEFAYDPENGLTFEAWYIRYQGLFLVDAKDLDDAAKVRLLLRKLNTASHKQYVDFILPKEYKDFDFATTVDKLSHMFGKKISLFHQRFNCMNSTKSSNQDFLAHAALINKRCEEFKISTITADQFKCLIFICSLRSPSDAEIRTKLLNLIRTKPDTLTIEDLAIECQGLVNIKLDTSMIQNQKSEAGAGTVALVKSDQNRKNKAKFQKNYKNLHQGKKQIKNSLPDKDSTPSTPCWFCGQLHYSKDCTFKSHKCQKCNLVGHKDGYCASSKRVKPKMNNSNFSNKNVNIIQVKQVASNNKRKFVDIFINNHKLKLQLDTGSDISIISEKNWSILGKPQGYLTSHVARDASGNEIKFKREFNCIVSFKGISKQLKCFVTSNLDLNILGLDWLTAFNLWDQPLNSFCMKVDTQSFSADSVTASSLQFDISFFKERFAEVFSSELGRCTKTKVKLFLKPDAKPIFRPKRPVAYAILPIVDQELTRLEQNGIISPIKYSDWATPIVVVRKKNGKIRICADFSTGLNASLEPNRHPLPLPDEIFSQLSNCKYFSQLDLSDAFLQIEIEEESKRLLTINTHRGLFVYNRLPFGVTTAPGEFQAIIDSMISGLKNVFAYIDDIVVGGATIQEHNRNLTRLLERIKDYGFHLRIEKCNFFTTKINYLGYVIDGAGLHPDPKKVEAITNMPSPHNVSTLRSFLGAINYYGRFISNMHILRRPLDNLLKKDTKWDWSNKCQESFIQFKRILTSNLLLTHYNPKYEIVVAADASNEGIGACILHRFPDHSVKAISHASRSLTETERKYSQIEKEALALIFAVTKFHKMVFGRKFTLQTDHKPLLQIFGSKKGIPVYSANRLQRWALQLLSYDFKIEYIRTSEFGHADVLSRLISQQQRPEENFVIASVKMESELLAVINESLQLTPISFKQIQEATQEDSVIMKVINFTLKSWPQGAIDDELQPYYRRRDSFSVVQDCLLFNDRVVVPAKFHHQILKQIHKGHPGMERMKTIARSYVYWPKIDQHIEEFVRSCKNCALNAKSPVKVPLQSWPQPSKPWERIHIDFAGPFLGEYFFVIVDAYSKWPEIVPTQTITSQRTISILQEIFARFGFPETIVSDNGTQFMSERFQTYCLAQGITHLRSPPFHPSSNGQAERFVDTFKRGLLKIQTKEGKISEISDHLSTFLHCYRSTPNSNVPNGKSPAEAFLGRPLRTTLDLLKPTLPSFIQDNSRMKKFSKKLNQEAQYNRRHGVKHKEFEAGTQVYVQIHSNNKWTWVPGEIVERVGKVLYNVLVETRCRLVRAHANQLKLRHTSDVVDKESLPHKDDKESSPHLLPFEILFSTFDLDLDVPQQKENFSQEHSQHQHFPQLPQNSEEPMDVEVVDDIVNVPNEVVEVPQVNYEQQLQEAPSQDSELENQQVPETFVPETFVPETIASLEPELSVPIRRSQRSRRSPVKLKDYLRPDPKRGRCCRRQ